MISLCKRYCGFLKGSLLGISIVILMFIPDFINLGYSSLSLESMKTVIQISQLHQILIIILPVIFSLLFHLLELNKRNQKLLIDNQIKISKTAKLSSLGEMAAGIAHEINNPLAVISLKVEHLKCILAETMIKKSFHKDLDHICAMILKISTIIKGLKTFSRDGNHDPIETTNLAELIDDALSMISYKVEKYKIIVDKKYLIKPEAKVRKVQIEQVIVNLVNNAIDAIKDQDGDKIVKILVEPTDEFLLLKISDNGKNGIPPKVREKLFEPFYTTKAVGEGTGLGLSISKEILISHGGDLVLAEELPTTFILSIPKKSF